MSETTKAVPRNHLPSYPPEGFCTATEDYEYTALPTATTIRLLRVEANGDQGIHCTLEVFDLKDEPTYNALSYTWGCPFADFNFEFSDDPLAANYMHECYAVDRKIPVTCNGRRALVTRNLYEALQEISQASRDISQEWSSSEAREEDPSLDAVEEESLSDDLGTKMLGSFVWVDAICINEADLQERNAQVAIMGKIYSQASAVFIWLGRWLPRTEAALDLADYLADIPPDRYSTLAKYSPTFPGSLSSLGLRKVSTGEWGPLLSFLRRSWFHRVWVCSMSWGRI